MSLNDLEYVYIPIYDDFKIRKVAVTDENHKAVMFQIENNGVFISLEDAIQWLNQRAENAKLKLIKKLKDLDIKMSSHIPVIDN